MAVKSVKQSCSLEPFLPLMETFRHMVNECIRIGLPHYKDVFHKRQLWCTECMKWMDRDVVAAMNISRKGGEVFHRSKGDASEATKGNPTTPVILRVDASKLARGHVPKVNRTVLEQKGE